MIELVTKGTQHKNLTPHKIGGKGFGLIRLSRMERELTAHFKEYFPKGIIVPNFFIVPNGYDLGHFDDIRRCAEGLKSDKFAVRSSSPLEDRPTYSFDGIFRSNLNVRLEELYDAIEDVRGSALNDRARKHAEELGLDVNVGMAVVVQQMIDGVYRGVVYSKFPSSHDITKTIVLSNDEYMVDVFRRMVDNKGVPIGLRGRLIEGRLVISQTGKSTVLSISDYSKSEEEIIALVSHAIERNFGYPVRVEYLAPINYTLGEEHVHLVQSRPVTGQDQLTSAVQLPELQQGLILGTTKVNGSGDMTLPALNIVSPKYNSPGLQVGRVRKLDALYPKGYVLVCKQLQWGWMNYDEATPHKRAVVAIDDTKQHHDLDIVREKGILYLGSDTLDPFFRSDGKVPRLIKTGDMVRVVSDGIVGYLYKV